MNFYDFSAKGIHGQTVDFNDYEGKVILVVNTASLCGCTHQYEGLQRIYERYKDDGFVVLGFPCNQFGAQEPEDEAAIEEFVKSRYGITFPMFSKIDVVGEDAHPLFVALTEGEDPVHWNFEKFLIDREGHLRGRFPSDMEPRDMIHDIDELL